MRWPHWRLRIGFTPREALVLHEVGCEQDGGGRGRSLHRASIAELVDPVRRPEPDRALQERVRRRRVRHGPLRQRARARLRLPRRDPLPRRRASDRARRGARASPTPICLHEEDAGILWKHVDWRTRRATEVRRARRFVVSVASCTVGNYEYGLFWYLHQDGSIAFELKLTGILHTTGVEPGAAERRTRRWSRPGVAAPYHQHFLVRPPRPRRRRRRPTASSRWRPIRRSRGPEQSRTARRSDAPRGAAQRESRRGAACDPLRARRWRVENPARRNRMGHRSPTSSCPATTSRRARPGLRVRAPRRLHRRTTCG